MSADWWPKLLAHVPNERPWDDEHVTVAEIKSFSDKPHPGHRETFSALVPMDQLEQVAANLGKFGSCICTSGPHPTPHSGSTYRPGFWVEARDLPSQKYEPLILSWRSHDKTVLMPDPGFLMTYGLSPRNVKEGLVLWDDPAAPVHDVVKICAPSTWTFPSYSHAFVTVARKYLEDYLTLRGMALVQVFWEERWGSMDSDTQKKLRDAEAIDVRFPDRLFQLNRYIEDKTVAIAQVWGGRVVATAGRLPVSADSLDTDGLVWPGFPQPVTRKMAMQMRPSHYVYVSDAVLGEFEDRPGYKVNPNTGSVTFGTQWGVSHCERVGRNLIRLELKKLYEGVRPNITRHWNKFAVPPIPESAYPAILKERHIAERAKELTYAVAQLGNVLAVLAGSVGLGELRAEDFATFRKSALDYHGWWNFQETEAIARHIPLESSADTVLDRCVKLDKLLVEGIAEGNLRRLMIALGVPVKSLAKLKTLKLLDTIVRMAQLGVKTGLKLSSNGPIIWERLIKEGTMPAQPIRHLFALYDIRILGAHKSEDKYKNLMVELQRFGVDTGQEVAGYGRIIDLIYDILAEELVEVTKKIECAI
jgi:hypothetical protein